MTPSSWIVVAFLAFGFCANGQVADEEFVSLLQVRAKSISGDVEPQILKQFQQALVKISCWTKNTVYFYAGPEYIPSSGWSPCASKYDADFYAFSEYVPGARKITCYTKNGNYFYGGPDYTTEWPSCTSKGIVAADFYAFESPWPGSVLISCNHDLNKYFYSGPGYNSGWPSCYAKNDATWYAFQHPSDYTQAPTPAPAPTTTTTTVVNLEDLADDERETEIYDEQTNTRECQKWCYSMKHDHKAWIGKKCEWFACSKCSECR